MNKLFSLLYLLTTLSFSTICRGDSWMAPSPLVFASEDGRTGFKVVPRQTEGFKGKANATSFRLDADGNEQVLNKFQLVNNPMKALVPQQSVNYLVTLDTHANLGFEHTLVIYRSNGQIVRDLKLEDLLTEKEIMEHVGRSVSSRWWREGATFSFEIPFTQTVDDKDEHKMTTVRYHPEDTKLHIALPWKKEVVIKLATGEVLP